MANESLGANFSIDITNLKAGLKEANQLIKESQSEFKAAAAGMDDWTKSEEGLNAKIKSLTSTADAQRAKVTALKQEYERLINDGLDPASTEASKLRTQINNEEAALAKTEKEINDNTKALDELGDESDDTGGKMSKFGDIMKGVGKVAAAAVGAAAAGLAALTKQAVEGYAEYEQLVGGVETLFGTGGQSLEEYAKSVGKSVEAAKGDYEKLQAAQDTMLKNANDAYKTAGMSANDYMANVTSFSASLISSLDGDTQAAADAANSAMIDMSDNANKMGTDMQTIVDTYQSLAKGNYQMLDNLKLGYGGTKAEMERLIADANRVKEANGEMADLSIDSFADMTEAIHIIQNEMGISGTTAKEASSTIQGSASAMKAAWSNLVTGMADENANIDQLIENLVDSIGTFLDNLLPRIVVATNGIIKVIEGLIPSIPPLIEKFMPVIIEGIMNLLDGVVAVLPTIIDTIMQVIPDLISRLIEMIPTLIETTIKIIVQIINAISGMIPTIVEAVMTVLPLIISSLVNSIPDLLEAAITLLLAIVEAIPTIVKELTKSLPEIISTIIDTLLHNIPLLINAATELFLAIVEAIPEILPDLIKAIPQIIESIVKGLTNKEAINNIAEAGKELIKGLWNGISDMAKWIYQKIEGFGKGVLDKLKGFFGIKSPSKLMRDQVGKNLALGIGEGFTKNIGKVNDEITDAMNFSDPKMNISGTYNGGGIGSGKNIVVNQYNTYSQAHSRYEIYKSKQQTAAAVRLAIAGV